MIKTSAELDDETAETMESQIVTNQDMLAFFTNFDHWVDYVALSIWLLSLVSILLGVALFFVAKDEQEVGSKWNNEIIHAPDISNSMPVELETDNEFDGES